MIVQELMKVQERAGWLPQEELRALAQRLGVPLRRQHADRAPLGWRIDIYNGQPRYDAVRKLLETHDAVGVLKALEVAGLRGMGGAGFPTFRKWAAVRDAKSDDKYIVCNADES